jgi:hypothetical protein
MRIGELAAQAGMTKDTIRFYEKIGLVAGGRLAIVDARMAELAALRADLKARVGTGCPLRGGAG